MRVGDVGNALYISGLKGFFDNFYLHQHIEWIQLNITSSKDCSERILFREDIYTLASTKQFRETSLGNTSMVISSQNDIPELEVNALLFVNRARNRTHLEETLQNLRKSVINVTLSDTIIKLAFFPIDKQSEFPKPIPEKDVCRFLNLKFNNSAVAQTGIQFFNVNELLLCVQAAIENYTKDIIDTLCIHNITFEISADNKTIRFCEKHWAKLGLDISDEDISLFHFAYGIFSMICTLLSLVCLLITFLTYSIFRSLRNIPGVNNMNLVFSLFWAQLFLQFGLWQTGNETVCIFLGVMTHYFWLASFCGMNVCSYHMFKVFHKPLVSSGNLNQRKLVYYSLYIYGAPFILISIFLLVIVTTSSFTRFGYGNGICFLSNFIAILIMFIIPANLIIVLNIVFFGIAYWYIRSSPRVQTNINRNYFKVYIKLFTITGIAWVLLFVDTLNSPSLFSFVATFSGALQGVYIFLAFLCNKKIWTLYKNLFCKKHCWFARSRKQTTAFKNLKSATSSNEWIQSQLEKSKETFV